MKRKYKGKPLLKKTCEYCQEFYITRREEAKFCCTNHRVLWHYHMDTGTAITKKNISINSIWPKVISTRDDHGFEICLNQDGSYLMRSL